MSNLSRSHGNGDKGEEKDIRAIQYDSENKGETPKPDRKLKAPQMGTLRLEEGQMISCMLGIAQINLDRKHLMHRLAVEDEIFMLQSDDASLEQIGDAFSRCSRAEKEVVVALEGYSNALKQVPAKSEKS